MLDFVRKEFLWNAWDAELHKEIGKTGSFHLKSIQDLAVYHYLRGISGKRIGEVGGGASRLLRPLSQKNECYNIERFDGSHGGPAKEIVIPGVTNINAFLGTFDEKVPSDHFDVLCSVSVVEHVADKNLDNFVADGVRALRKGGLWVHAIDMYLGDAPNADTDRRFLQYRGWLERPDLEPLGPVYDGPLEFFCDMATNPDDTMHAWGKIAPNLIPVRKTAQSVSIILAARRR